MRFPNENENFLPKTSKTRQFLGYLNIRIISSLFPNPSYKYLRVVAPVQVYPPKQ